jgi:hypothetical protein
MRHVATSPFAAGRTEQRDQSRDRCRLGASVGEISRVPDWDTRIAASRSRSIGERRATPTTICGNLTLSSCCTTVCFAETLTNGWLGFLLEPSDRAPASNDAARRSAHSPALAKTGAARGKTVWRDLHARDIREWLLLLLRFAITMDPEDQAVALRIAGEIDSRGVERRPSTLSFSLRRDHRARGWF